MNKNYKLIEVRRIDIEKLRCTCINGNWYTKGNSKEYCDMFKLAKKGGKLGACIRLFFGNGETATFSKKSKLNYEVL